MKTPKPVTLGCVARDKITSFVGVAIAESLWLNGCRRFILQSQTLKDGKGIEDTFDAQNLEYVKEGPVKPLFLIQLIPVEQGATAPGGPRAFPTRSKDPTR